MDRKSVAKIKKHLIAAEKIAQEELGLENIFYNERFIELFIADALGHEYGNNTQGGDAFDTKTQKPTEYKAINRRSKSGGKGSFQFHWLSENKMKKYKQTDKMYCVMRDGVSLEEIYEVDTKKILKAMGHNSTNSESIHGHAGFSLKKLKENLGAKKIEPSP